jgi:hypothetical protein
MHMTVILWISTCDRSECVSTAQRDRIIRTTVPYFWGPGFKTGQGEEFFLLTTIKCPYTRFLSLRGFAGGLAVLLMCCGASLGGGILSCQDREEVSGRRTLIAERISTMSQNNGQIKCLYHTPKSGQDRFFVCLLFYYYLPPVIAGPSGRAV